MNEKIIFDIVLILLLVFLIVSTFVDYYKLTHPCMVTINNAKILCTKIDKHVVIECINNKNVIKKLSGTATFDYEGHVLTYSNKEFIDNCAPGTYYQADIHIARYIHDKSPYFMIANIYPEPLTQPADTQKED